MKKINVVDYVEKISVELADRLELELVDVDYVKEAGQYFLRIYLDTEEGITLDECERFTREINPILDKDDKIKENYFLEVSSPGIDRALKKDKDFVRYAGRDVDIKLFKAIDGVKQFEACLKYLDENNMVVLERDGEEIKIDKKDAAVIRLAVKF